MFSAWSLFDSPKLIIFAELSSPAANFKSDQPQVRTPKMQFGIFNKHPNSKNYGAFPRAFLSPQKLTDRALNIGNVNACLLFPKVNFRKSNPNAIENPLKSQTVIIFLAMQKSEKQNRAMQPKRIRQSPVKNVNEKQW